MTPTPSARATTSGDAIDLLTDDHDEITELFARFDALASDGASTDERQSLAEEICSLLLVQAAVKEEIFYPAARHMLEAEYLVDEALIAQDSLVSLIGEIQAGDPTEPRYDAQVKMLQELALQAFEDERTALFPRVRETTLDLDELGAEMSARQEILLSADDESGLD